MKHIKMFESKYDEISLISIEEFLDAIKFPYDSKQIVIEWWNENRSRINIYYFPFKTSVGIMGSVISSDSVAINSKFNNPPHFLLYLALHESVHADQAFEGRIAPYFDTVVVDDYEGFLRAYGSLEREANDYAQNAMLDMGFEDFISSNMQMLRINEGAGSMVFSAMKSEIQKNNPKDLVEMIQKMIM